MEDDVSDGLLSITKLMVSAWTISVDSTDSKIEKFSAAALVATSQVILDVLDNSLSVREALIGNKNHRIRIDR